MKLFTSIQVFIIIVIQTLNAQQSPARFVSEVYDDIYQVMRTRQSPEKPNLVLSENKRDIANFNSLENQIKVGQDFIDLARDFGEDSVNVVAHVMSHELAHVLLEQSTIIRDIGSGYASVEFNKSLEKKDKTLRDSLFERQADEYSFFYAQLAGYRTSDLASQILDSIYMKWGLKDEDLKKYPPLLERKLIATTASKKIKILKELFDVAVLSNISGNYDLAIHLFKFILEEDFDSREIHNNLGSAYLLKAIKSLDTLDYPYRFPVQIDLNTELDIHRGIGQATENDLKKALEQFIFAIEGKGKYPIAMLNKAICEWLLEEKEEYEISMIRLYNLNDSLIRQKASILKAIDFYHNDDKTSSQKLLKELGGNNSLADINHKILFKNYQEHSHEEQSIPSYELPIFDFNNSDLAKSDTLENIFGLNAKYYSLIKLSNSNWTGYRVKSYKASSSLALTIYETSDIPDSFHELKGLTPNFETARNKYILLNRTILKFDRNDQLLTIYHLI